MFDRRWAQFKLNVSQMKACELIWDHRPSSGSSVLIKSSSQDGPDLDRPYKIVYRHDVNKKRVNASLK